ncbi:hypothetical protein CHS0354_019161 [Potamilus streckersoni]|uniref:Uncharacterized protein n=1 Tax=Potamilus streckersoni TaxID=2493646 RepID=A0AAE0SZR9_9BIVA|nr:hypothetical protein CHS0354_019161 [Potamilus streckersoni]
MYCSINDGSIKVINPDPKIYTYIFANDDNNICQVKWSSERKFATITKCDQDEDNQF